MEKTAELAGYWGAQALTLVAESHAPLAPLFAVENKAGESHLVQIMKNRLEESAAEGVKWLDTNPFDAARAVLVYEAFFTLGTDRMDTVIVDARLYSKKPAQLKLALPYRPASSPAGFAIHRPKVLQIPNSPGEVQAIMGAFMRGVARHEKGNELWKSRMDRQ
jgi:hypothetical protein